MTKYFVSVSVVPGNKRLCSIFSVYFSILRNLSYRLFQLILTFQIIFNLLVLFSSGATYICSLRKCSYFNLVFQQQWNSKIKLCNFQHDCHSTNFIPLKYGVNNFQIKCNLCTTSIALLQLSSKFFQENFILKFNRAHNYRSIL